MNLQVEKAKFSLYTPWRHIGEVVVNYHAFLTSALDVQLDAPADLPPG
jgi:hypothetical protein